MLKIQLCHHSNKLNLQQFKQETVLLNGNTLQCYCYVIWNANVFEHKLEWSMEWYVNLGRGCLEKKKKQSQCLRNSNTMLPCKHCRKCRSVIVI